MRRWLPLSATNLRIGCESDSSLGTTSCICIRSEPFTRPPIHCMGLSHSLNNLSSEQAWPMCSTRNRVNGDRGSSGRQPIGMLRQPAIISTSLHRIIKLRSPVIHNHLAPTKRQQTRIAKLSITSPLPSPLISCRVNGAGQYTRLWSRSLCNQRGHGPAPYTRQAVESRLANGSEHTFYRPNSKFIQVL